MSFLKNKLFLVSAALLLLIAGSYILPLLEPLRHSFYDYAARIWWAILLGLLIGGFLDYYVPDAIVGHLLARSGRRTVFYSVVLGFFLSACSHGILALGIELHKKGASTSSVIAFLLASPWANLPVTIMMFGFFGTGALYIIFAAILIAIITGLIYQVLESKEWVESNPKSGKSSADFSLRKEFRKQFSNYEFSLKQIKKDARGILKGSVSLANMVMFWILLGIGIASVAGAYVPHDFFREYMGASILGLAITLLVATVIEVCSEGSAPMALELFKQTGALGNSFVFLMAGVATDYTEIGLIWSNIGRRAAIFLPIVTVPQVVLVGWLMNVLL